MVYLDYFEIPKDSWVDYYFNVPEDNEEAHIKIIIRENIPDHIGHVTKKRMVILGILGMFCMGEVGDILTLVI